MAQAEYHYETVNLLQGMEMVAKQVFDSHSNVSISSGIPITMHVDTLLSYLDFKKFYLIYESDIWDALEVEAKKTDVSIIEYVVNNSDAEIFAPENINRMDETLVKLYLEILSAHNIVI